MNFSNERKSELIITYMQKVFTICVCVCASSRTRHCGNGFVELTLNQFDSSFRLHKYAFNNHILNDE